MKKLIFILSFSALIIVLLVALLWKDGVARLKAEGYIPYTPAEAQALAYNKCSQCHNTDKIAKYCMRCGPPLVVVVHNMKTLVRIENEKGKHLDGFTDAQAVAITQVWNALVGNWEKTFRLQDLAKLLEGDKALIKLTETPVKERPLEMAFAGKSMPGVYKEQQGQNAPAH